MFFLCVPIYIYVQIGMKSDTPVSVASSFIQSTLAKPIVTTAPSSVQQNPQIISQNIPPLKQKTGIIKSKVPPPVPPRGSPRVDRRTSTGSYKSSHGISPRTTSPGIPNYLNDKYFNMIQQNANNMCRLSPQKLNYNNERRTSTPQPIFGKSRSPTCVRDWLEINDFAASDYDSSIKIFEITEPYKCATIKPRKPLPIKTGYLQRQSSFYEFSCNNEASVRSMVENYSKNQSFSRYNLAVFTDAKNHIDAEATKCIGKNFVSDRIKSYDHNNQVNHNNKDDKQDQINVPSIRIINPAQEQSNFIFNSLKRKTKTNNNNKANNRNLNEAIDKNGKISAKKCEILRSHSNIESDENDIFLDAFSLDGEFV